MVNYDVIGSIFGPNCVNSNGCSRQFATSCSKLTATKFPDLYPDKSDKRTSSDWLLNSLNIIFCCISTYNANHMRTTLPPTPLATGEKTKSFTKGEKF